MSCYFVAQITIHDTELYEKYLDGFDAAFEKFHGTVVAEDDDTVSIEGDWPFTRTVLIRFPDRAEAQRWYGSEEYQQIVRHRHRASDANIALVEGRD